MLMTEQAPESEYYDAMVTLLEWLWGQDFMAPGGEGNVDRMMRGLEVRGKCILDIGCGLGGPAFVLAGKYGAHVTGIDLERHLVERARRRAAEIGLEHQIEFLTVDPGPLDFPDHSFDVVFTSGSLTQTEDKSGIIDECRRVLNPGGMLTCYEWLTHQDVLSADMLYFFEMEGLTYHLVTLDEFGGLLASSGFEQIELEDSSDWYRKEARREYELMRGPQYSRVLNMIGQKQADHLIEDWRSMVVVCEKGELRQGYLRARNPRPDELGV
jgi:phosphoethanolamine N-methyltransferase